MLSQSLFVSHAGVDREVIRARLFRPLDDLCEFEQRFFYSRRVPRAEDYRDLVRAALHWCDKFVAVLSTNSLNNSWVRAEVESILRDRKLLFVVRLDGCRWCDMLRTLDVSSSRARVRVFDLSNASEFHERRLRTSLVRLVQQYPFGPLPDRSSFER